MAIQNRRGLYEDFVPSRLKAGELAVVTGGDPNSSTGRSLYICFEPGTVQRIADYEDIRDLVADAAQQYIDEFDDAVDAVTTLIPDTEAAKNAANAAATSANNAAADARAVVSTVQSIWVDIGTVSSLPVTKSATEIKSTMKCAEAVLGTPSAQNSDWTVTTSDGSVTISGTISGSTTVGLLLVPVNEIS